MINIISNGSKWAGEQPEPLETLLAVLAMEPLDPDFELFGNFVIANPKYLDGKIGNHTRFFGNFANLSHVFSIDSDDPKVISKLTAAIRENQKTEAYKHEREIRTVDGKLESFGERFAKQSNIRKSIKSLATNPR